MISKKKKKKKKKVFAKIQSDFSAEIQNSKRFFRPKSSEKKKGLFAKIQGDFSSKNFASSNVSDGALFAWGGAFFNLSQKIGLKSTKNMRFCILHKPMGGARAPPASPLATLLVVGNFQITVQAKMTSVRSKLYRINQNILARTKNHFRRVAC